MKAGRGYEKIVEELYRSLLIRNPEAKITRNAVVGGYDGTREIDILIETSLADFKLKTVIECKDWSKKVDVPVIDAFASKLQDVKANKGIIVSRSGFSGKAKKKADRLAIELRTADQAANIDSSTLPSLPIVCRDLREGTIQFEIKIQSVGGAKNTISLDFQMLADRIDLNEKIKSKFGMRLADGTEPIRIRCTSEEVTPAISLRANGRSHDVIVEDAHAVVEAKGPIYFGFLNELPSAILSENSITGDRILAATMPKLDRITDHLRAYSRIEDLPNYAKRLYLTVLIFPDEWNISGAPELYVREAP